MTLSPVSLGCCRAEGEGTVSKSFEETETLGRDGLRGVTGNER